MLTIFFLGELDEREVEVLEDWSIVKSEIRICQKSRIQLSQNVLTYLLMEMVHAPMFFSKISAKSRYEVFLGRSAK